MADGIVKTIEVVPTPSEALVSDEGVTLVAPKFVLRWLKETLLEARYGYVTPEEAEWADEAVRVIVSGM